MTPHPIAIGLILGLALFPSLLFVATLIIRDARSYRRRVAPLNEQARAEGRLRGLVLSGAATTPVPGRPLRLGKRAIGGGR